MKISKYPIAILFFMSETENIWLNLVQPCTSRYHQECVGYQPSVRIAVNQNYPSFSLHLCFLKTVMSRLFRKPSHLCIYDHPEM